MPIYDYLCSNCRHVTEVIHGIHDSGPRFCPSCGADGTMKKALSTPTVHFKGSGWAKKDRSSASSARTKAAASSTTKGEVPAEGSSSKAEASEHASGSSESTDTSKKPASSATSED